MSDALATYLHDHLAGSHFAIKLLDSLIEQHADNPIGEFAANIRAEIREDQATLEQIVERVGNTHFSLAEAAGWIAEKASQFKLRRQESANGDFGSFEAIETLSLGIRGKEALWKTLTKVREFDATIPPLNFQALITRAREQFERTEQLRLRLISPTFGFDEKTDRRLTAILDS